LREVAKVKSSGLNVTLKPYRGDPQPLPLDLYSVEGARVTRSDYTGKVTVVNFWATWCPPCVEEIPSLNRLRGLMRGRPFELISVNYAEDGRRVRQFMQQVDVDFPVLLDEDGRVSSAWNVLAFPSTFVIGKEGLIIYGVNAGIHWDQPDVVRILNKLMEQETP
jgi:thiol-disulfide isomerase/thioredoxin